MKNRYPPRNLPKFQGDETIDECEASLKYWQATYREWQMLDDYSESVANVRMAMNRRITHLTERIDVLRKSMVQATLETRVDETRAATQERPFSIPF